MAAAPLTHHEILELVEPFTRRGRHVDLAASNRNERRLLFVPIEHPAAALLPFSVRETLELHSHGTGTCVLTRVLTAANGLQARCLALGSRPGDLLAQIESVDPQQQFRSGPGYAVARSYEVNSRFARIILTEGVAQIEGLRLKLNVATVRGIAAEIVLRPTGAETLELPEDLLAVLGWDWARLIRDRDGWRTRLRLRGNLDKRSRSAEIALDRAAAHLAQSLSEPPGRFHDRWLAARWGVVFRRGIPVLTFVALVATVLSLPHFASAEGSDLWVLLFQVPTGLIALSFCLQELPQYEIPPLPRRSSAAGWRRSAEIGARDAQT